MKSRTRTYNNGCADCLSRCWMFAACFALMRRCCCTHRVNIGIASKYLSLTHLDTTYNININQANLKPQGNASLANINLNSPSNF